MGGGVPFSATVEVMSLRRSCYSSASYPLSSGAAIHREKQVGVMKLITVFHQMRGVLPPSV
jgi:hypothetical protein